MVDLVTERGCWFILRGPLVVPLGTKIDRLGRWCSGVEASWGEGGLRFLFVPFPFVGVRRASARPLPLAFSISVVSTRRNLGVGN